jgi:CRISPR-associated protein Csm3
MPRDIKQKPLLGKIRFTSTIILETGLHVGGGGDNLDIGGLDKPVIRDPLTQYPYIPGSSIKGKLRSILERLIPDKKLNRYGGSGIYRYESDDLEDGYTEIGDTEQNKLLIRFEGAKTCPISRLFGSTGGDCWVKTDAVNRDNLDKISNVESKNISETECRFVGKEEGNIGVSYTKIKGRNSPARLIVRDCHLLEKSAERLKKVDTGLYMTEWKFENSIDRVTAAANPRQFERVPADSQFKFEMVYTVEDKEQSIEDLKNIAIALAILEDDALGGHGSRGYGKVRFEKFEFFYRDLSQYSQMSSSGDGLSKPIKIFDNTSKFLEDFESLKKEIQQRLLKTAN